MSLFDELFGLDAGKRGVLSHILEEFLCVFREIRDTQKERLAVEKEISASLKKISVRPPLHAIVKFGAPVNQ